MLILLYSLIYFILECYTYIILLFFVCFIVLQNYLSESEFSWKRHLSEEVSSGHQKNQEKLEKEVSREITGEDQRRHGGEPGGHQVTPRHGPSLGRAYSHLVAVGPGSSSPLAYLPP